MHPFSSGAMVGSSVGVPTPERMGISVGAVTPDKIGIAVGASSGSSVV
jgi:hypothetical protein